MGTRQIITSYLLFLAFFLSGCVPRMSPPPLYSGSELTLDEVIQITGKDIDALKAIVDVSIEKKNEPYYSFISASALIRRPGQARMRIYKLGVPVNDILIKDEKVYLLSGSRSKVFDELGREFYHTVFWWDGMKDGILHKEGTEYIINTESREIHLDSETLFPIRQEIIKEGKSASIIYSEPGNDEGFWYPSVIDIKMGDFILKIQVKKLLLNPQIGEYDLVPRDLF